MDSHLKNGKLTDTVYHPVDWKFNEVKSCQCNTTYCSMCTRNRLLIRQARLKRDIIDFFRVNPYPKSNLIPKLARDLGLSRDELDEMIYMIFSDFVMKEF